MTFDLKQALSQTGTRALIFDMDGTLVDNMPFHFRAWLQWARSEGLTGSDDEILARTHGTLREIVRRLFPEETDEAVLIERGDRKEALYRELYRPHLQLLPGLAELLETARREGVPMALATAGDKPNIDFTLDGLDIRGYFAAVVGAEDVTRGKPHPEVFLCAAQKLGIAPEQCLVFEDSPAGVESARRAGMACVVVNPMGPRESFGETAHALHMAADYSSLVW